MGESKREEDVIVVVAAASSVVIVIIVVVFGIVHERFCTSRTPQGQNFPQFRQRYRIAPHVRYAVASRKNTDSLVKAMILLDQGGGGRGGGKRSWTILLPPVSPLSVALFWRRIFFRSFAFPPWQKLFGGRGPTGPPNLTFRVRTFYYPIIWRSYFLCTSSLSARYHLISSCHTWRVCLLAH